jgi:hypothetical protein
VIDVDRKVHYKKSRQIGSTKYILEISSN